MKTKVCSTCHKRKRIDCFNRKTSSKDGLEHYCKPCHRERNRKHYAGNKAAYKASAKKFKRDLRDWFQELKTTKHCERCGETKWWRLAFHHRDSADKDRDIARMVSNHVSRTRILKELEKCAVVCHNCHADLHYEERGVV